MTNKEHWQDWGTALIGAWLFVSPWLVGAPIAETSVSGPVVAAAWNFWLFGAILMALGFSELSAFARWKEWVVAAVGAWLFLSPRLLGYAELDGSTWNAAACGLATVALAGWAIGDTHDILPKLVRPKGDLRGNSAGLELPDEHEHLAGQQTHRPDSGPGILAPGVGGSAPGQVTKSS